MLPSLTFWHLVGHYQSNYYFGGVLVSTGGLKWELHAADDSLAALTIESKTINANSNELALAA